MRVCVLNRFCYPHLGIPSKVGYEDSFLVEYFLYPAFICTMVQV